MTPAAGTTAAGSRRRRGRGLGIFFILGRAARSARRTSRAGRAGFVLVISLVEAASLENDPAAGTDQPLQLRFPALWTFLQAVSADGLDRFKFMAARGALVVVGGRVL